MSDPIFIPPVWLYNRSIIRRKDDPTEYVLRRQRLGPSAEESFFELLPVSMCDQWYAKREELDAAAQRVNVKTLMEEYEWTRRQMSVMRAPL